jgi:hypothetical protein
VFLTARWTIGIEADWGGEATIVRSTRVQFRGQTFDLETRHRNAARSVAVVTGFDAPPLGRLQVRGVGGMAFTRVRRAIESEAPAVVLQDPTQPDRTEYVDRFATVIVGVDAAIAIARGLAIVPAVRAQGLHLTDDIDGYSIRPSLGVRWTY